MTTSSQNKEEHVEDDDEGWIVVTNRKEIQPNFIQKESSFRQKHAKERISQKKKEKKRNKKMWKPKSLREFLPRRFIDVHHKEVLEVTACHVVGITKVDNTYASSKEIDNSNEIKQITSVFDRIKPSTTRSSVFQRLSMTTKEEENQC